ncbi:unnamed protein product [Phaedon cochleariae]|uniref:CHHC U11-48K-type domain-containing protein n=1 Tax=Phaedon cochleariae TaxID=80249 RepID=A0A9N9SF26_PHACE|nr:unnamed protein product [Phaedon cochleariae]
MLSMHNQNIHSIRSERMVKCPFNPQHVMSPSSLQRHIIRCMVNYPNFVVCPYNALHRFRNKDLLADHMLQCDSRSKAYIMDEVNDDIKQEVCYHIDKIRAFNLEHENWDED